jgi:rhamnose transport system ATP-binding protein
LSLQQAPRPGPLPRAGEGEEALKEPSPPHQGRGQGEREPEARAEPAPIVELRGITKRFGPVEVLSEVDLALHAGRVHSLAGENGAGKSTLVKILGGIHQPDAGEILLDGAAIAVDGAADARRHGIAVVHQHPALFPDLSAAENIFAGRQPRRFGRIDWPSMHAQARALLARLGLELDVRLPVKMLGVAERHAVEIARALSLEARVLVLDEPTSAISAREVARLFELVRRLKEHGVAILFISHFIDEILSLGDDVTILRGGRRVTTAPARALTPEQTVRHMVGTAPEALFPKEAAAIGAPLLSVRGLSGAGFVEDVSFTLRAGEILGFFGLVGAGRSEVAEMLFGIAPPERGEIRLDERRVDLRSPHDALALGISLVPEDRHQQGLVLQFPIRANETLPVLQRLSGVFGLVNRKGEARVAADFAARMRVIATGIEQLTSTLSGGNQQKVLLAKWLIPSPRVLILDQPTRGIDVGAKAEIHRIVSHLAAQGVAIILISDEAPEVIAMADRILVFRAGHIAAEFSRATADREAIMLAAAHTTRDAATPPPREPA